MNYPEWVWAASKLKEGLDNTVGNCQFDVIYVDISLVQCVRPSEGWSFFIDFHLAKVVFDAPSTLKQSVDDSEYVLVFHDSMQKFAAQYSGLFHMNHVGVRRSRSNLSVFTNKHTTMVKFNAP